jgi:hypothetical protein
MKTPKTHSHIALIPASLLAFSLSALCPTSAQAQSQQSASKRVAAVNPPQQPSQPAPTLAANIDRQLSRVETLIVDAAEAMPEDKFNFTPESLKIPGSEYKGVFTFAGRSSTSRRGTISSGRRSRATNWTRNYSTMAADRTI